MLFEIETFIIRTKMVSTSFGKAIRNCEKLSPHKCQLRAQMETKEAIQSHNDQNEIKKNTYKEK